MAATSSATRSATAAAVPPDVLSVDTGAQVGPASYGEPGSPAAPTVPGGPSPLPGQAPVTAPGYAGQFYDGDGEGAWPALPESGDGRQALDRGEGFPQGVTETQDPNTAGRGFWANDEQLQTFDALSQHTDNAGWQLNVPNDRVSVRETRGHENPGNSPTWYGYSENVALKHFAISAAPLTADEFAQGTPGFSNGALPDWSQTGGQGNTVYDTPAPPATSAVAQVTVPDPAAGWA